ncbi:MAG: (2Fe-2S)-binding protein [Trueperaceae bacterium]|nr:(2Fe-2S)-binding protein [Trueperaceae bacterium]
MLRTQRKFIEAVIEEVRDAKDVLMPALAIDDPEAPWTAASLERLRGQLDTLDPLIREAAEMVLTFELPFIVEEERLAAEGVTLAADMGRFELAMVEFERAFWDARYAEHVADPGRWHLREVPTYDICEQHRLDSDRVRRAIRDHGATSFEDVAPILGTGPTCADCKTGITRLLIQELRRQKAQAN